MTKAIPGVILAGGLASRMGGGDKGLKKIGQSRLIDLVIDRLAPQCDELAINANGDPNRFAEFAFAVLPDSITGYPGALAGVLAGLDWAHAQGYEAIVTAAADTPFFPKDLVDELLRNQGPKGLCLAASSVDGGKMFRQPTFGLWPVALREDLRVALSDGLRKVVLWTDKHEAGSAEFFGQTYDPFFNINSPSDIEEAEMILAKENP